jgi:membrane fusion protein (multidrug efflux system)
MNGNKLIIVYLTLILALFISSCKSSNRPGQYGGPVPVGTYTVQTGKVVYYDSYPGTVAAMNEVQLHSEVSGYVTGIYFREGSQVNKGAALYEIDRRKYQAAYDEAKASAEIAASNLEKAQRDADRYKKLDAENAIAKQILEDAITALENARMQLKSSKASLSNAETDFNYSLITAPFTGSIGFSLVKPGAFVTAGQTLLNTISSDDPMGVDFIVDEKSLPYFLKLQNNQVAATDSTFRIELADNSGYKYSGKLNIIDRAVDPQTGSIKIRAVFPNPERSLRPGMNCKIKVLNKDSGSQIYVPFRAIIEQMSEYFVYLIDKNTVRQKRIELGPNLGEIVVIKLGLNPGDRIVLEGIQKVHEGSTIIPADSIGKTDKNKPVSDQSKQIKR